MIIFKYLVDFFLTGLTIVIAYHGVRIFWKEEKTLKPIILFLTARIMMYVTVSVWDKWGF